MTVPAQSPRWIYNGDGVSLSFAYPSVFEKAADLLVFGYLSGARTDYILNTDYTVTGGDVGNGPATGAVHFLVAPVAGVTIWLIGDPAPTQLLNLIESGAQPAVALENAWDYLTLQVQRILDKLNFAITFPDDYQTFNPEIPEGNAAGGAALAGKILQVSPTGTRWVWATPVTLPGDVVENVAVLSNNEAVPFDVGGMTIDAVTIRGIIFEYDLIRSDGATTEVRAIGRLVCVWNSVLLAWQLFDSYDGDFCGIVFSAVTTGTALQVKYTSTDIAGSFTKINFKTRTFDL